MVASMTRVPTRIHGKGFVEIYGDVDAAVTILFCCRENFQLDDVFFHRLVEHFTSRGARLVQHISRADLNFRRTDPRWLLGHSRWFRRCIKGVILLGTPRGWPHLLPGIRARARAISTRSRSLGELITSLDRTGIVLLGRSSGARLASLVADDPRVGKVVCLGYPFQNPMEGPNPLRYKHLPKVETPMLMIQGDADPYGGKGVEELYEFAANTTLHFAETDHSFDLSDAQWLEITATMDAFMGI